MQVKRTHQKVFKGWSKYTKSNKLFEKEHQEIRGDKGRDKNMDTHTEERKQRKERTQKESRYQNKTVSKSEGEGH